MSRAVQHEFAPPPPRGMGPALLLALLAHGVLALILTAGVQWKRSAPLQVAYEAELWSAVPQQAAPAAPIDVPEEPTAATPPLPPVPVEPVKPPAPVAKTPAPDITLAREKERQKKEEQQRLELERQKQEKLKQEKEKEKAAKDKAEKERLDKEKLAKERQKDDKQAKLDATKKEKEEQRKLEEMRQQNLKRLAGLAASGGGTGDAKSTGTAEQSSGPSGPYLARVAARIKAKIVFTDSQKRDIAGNPGFEVDIRATANGTLLDPIVVKSSGVKEWDEAVLSAIRKTETLPAGENGKVPSSIPFTFRPKD